MTRDREDDRAMDGGEAGGAAVDPERRKALRKIGRFAQYTAPAMMTLVVAQKATAQTAPISTGSFTFDTRNTDN